MVSGENSLLYVYSEEGFTPRLSSEERVDLEPKNRLMSPSTWLATLARGVFTG